MFTLDKICYNLHQPLYRRQLFLSANQIYWNTYQLTLKLALSLCSQGMAEFTMNVFTFRVHYLTLHFKIHLKRPLKHHSPIRWTDKNMEGKKSEKKKVRFSFPGLISFIESKIVKKKHLIKNNLQQNNQHQIKIVIKKELEPRIIWLHWAQKVYEVEPYIILILNLNASNLYFIICYKWIRKKISRLRGKILVYRHSVNNHDEYLLISRNRFHTHSFYLVRDYKNTLGFKDDINY